MKLEATTKNTLIKYGAMTLGVVVLGTIAYFVVVNPLLKWTGLKDDKVDKTAKKEADKQKGAGYWSPNYYLDKQNRLTTNATRADALASSLKRKIDGFFSIEDESGIYSQLSELKTFADLSFVASKYKKFFNEDLLTELIDDLNSEELMEVFSITNRLSN